MQSLNSFPKDERGIYQIQNTFCLKLNPAKKSMCANSARLVDLTTYKVVAESAVKSYGFAGQSSLETIDHSDILFLQRLADDNNAKVQIFIRGAWIDLPSKTTGGVC
ncbi:hypothetical protein COT97_01010 [Candidatus Falkowbacteria bacterium CG10_big_fil_rev_8_21_14_0_10_39_11]|uniref:Uncharacterized protein n=1 Tax=Candidatus Falkowbacteria bacterium CG10_big_fil_rev_8_21_14_0_10_39_11 TaxID=1974565 RepID=A0A2H0V609_9BACT|nr:MAG: hypothetical protein COT97_01010 [Candidatus Falkowbacteria bacterium CG10_big_fil_rev_8_21_14_0_10_39_11]